MDVDNGGSVLTSTSRLQQVNKLVSRSRWTNTSIRIVNVPISDWSVLSFIRDKVFSSPNGGGMIWSSTPTVTGQVFYVKRRHPTFYSTHTGSSGNLDWSRNHHHHKDRTMSFVLRHHTLRWERFFHARDRSPPPVTYCYPNWRVVKRLRNRKDIFSDFKNQG